jgi:sialic acid synthase SpsE
MDFQKIKQLFLKDNRRTFVIADIGSNHMQDLILAKESIDAAAEAGADAIKFQSIQLNELYLDPDPTTAAFVKKLEFPEEWHYILKEYCDAKGIIFFSSPTYLRAVDILEEVNVPLYKLASAQVGTFPQIVEKVAALQKPVIFSTGIAAYDEVVQAVRIFEKHHNYEYIILHCNSIYPTPPGRVNLQMIKTYQAMFHQPVGYSDHTVGIHIASAAVVMGAKVIEKHFTLDRSLSAPDSNEFASDPLEFATLVKNIRDIESASFGFDHRLDIQEEEKNFKEEIKYRLILQNNKKEGEIILEKDIKYLRNKHGIDAVKFHAISKEKILAVKDIFSGTVITEKLIQFL